MTMSHQQPDFLLYLPSELIIIIYKCCSASSHDSLEDLKSMRLTCKTIETALTPEFKALFTRKTSMLTDSSLNVIIDISKSRFAQSVREIKITTTYLTGKGFQQWEEYEEDIDGPHRKSTAFLAECTAQAELLKSGRAVRLLAEAFDGLGSALESVCITDKDQLAAIGRRHIMNACGSWNEENMPLTPDYFGRFTATCIATVLQALGRSSKARPKILEFQAHCVSDRAFRLPSGQDLSGVEELVISIDRCESESLSRTVPSAEVATYTFRHFLSRLRKLKCLRLIRGFEKDPNPPFGRNRPLDSFADTDYDEGQEEVGGEIEDGDDNSSSYVALSLNRNAGQQQCILRWLAATPVDYFARPRTVTPLPIAFAHIRELDIGYSAARIANRRYRMDQSTTMDPGVLLSFITKLKPTLRVLQLYVSLARKINMAVDTDPAAIKPNLWQFFLRSLGSSGVTLESITIFEPCQKLLAFRQDEVEGVVFFGTEEGAMGVSQEEYTVFHKGSHTIEMVNNLADKAILLESFDQLRRLSNEDFNDRLQDLFEFEDDGVDFF